MGDRDFNAAHVPVLQEEMLAMFEGLEIKTFFEGTLGAGGHAEGVLKAHPEIERYIACDRDPVALEIAGERLAPWKDKVEFVRGDFRDLDRHLKEKGLQAVDGFFLTWGCHRCN